MSIFLFKLAQFVMVPLRFLGEDTTDPTDIQDATWYKNVMEPILSLMENILVPLLILVGTAGSIYAVILGVNYSKAEDAGKREEAKKRLVNAVIGLVIMIALLIVLWLFTKYAAQIVDWIQSLGGGTTA